MLNSIQPERLLKQYLALLLIFYAIDAIALLCNIILPFGLTYGPLLYFFLKGVNNHGLMKLYIHFIPLYLFIFLYLLYTLGELYSTNSFNVVYKFYNSFLYIVVLISILLYSIMIWTSGNHKFEKSDWFVPGLVIANLLYALAFTILGYHEPAKMYGITFILLLILLAAIIILVFYLFSYNLRNKKIIPAFSEKIGEKSIEELKVLVMDSLGKAGLYRDPLLTLEMLANKIDVPRHHLSYFLNRYLGKSFYQLVAEYRIDYAKRRLNEDKRVTIERLAYECGFSSKTSLNRYFREITGLAPSQYRMGVK